MRGLLPDPSMAVFLLAFLLMRPAGAAAQAAASPRPHAVQSFIGVGLATGTNDDANRFPVPDGIVDHEATSSLLWDFEGAVRLTRRVALGVEVTRFEDLRGGMTAGPTWSWRYVESESTVVGTIRIRAADTPKVALDLIGGAGLLVPTFTSTYATDGVERSSSYTRRSAAFSLGCDVSFAAGRHLTIAPVLRVLRLARRMEEEPTYHGGMSCGWTDGSCLQPSTRVTAGVRLRVGK